MTVFRGYLKITQKTIPMILMYFGIFLVIFFCISLTESAAPTEDFAPAKLSVAFVDRDKGEAAKGLMDYMGALHELVDLPDDKAELQEALFYRKVDYIVYIPEDFETRCLKEKQPLEVTKVPGSYTGFYADQHIDRYMNALRVFLAGGYSLSEAIDQTIRSAGETADVVFSEDALLAVPRYYYLYRFFPYLLISIMAYGCSTVMLAFRQRDIQMRMNCSPYSPTRQNLQASLAVLLQGICYLAAVLLLPMILDGPAFFSSPHLPYYFINAALCMGMSLSLAFLVGMAAKNMNMISSITTTVSLCLCFLGGVFVPIDFMNRGIINIARFLPVYWYELINDTLIQFPDFSEKALAAVHQGIFIQCIYIIALLAVGLAVGKYRYRSASSL